MCEYKNGKLIPCSGIDWVYEEHQIPIMFCRYTKRILEWHNPKRRKFINEDQNHSKEANIQEG